MTLSARRILLRFLLIFTLFFTLLSTAYIIYELRETNHFSDFRPFIRQYWWKIITLDPYDIIHSYSGLAMHLAFSFLSVLICNHFFRKSTSAEIFFFQLFLLSIAFQGIRILQPYFISEGFSPFFGANLTKAAYFLKMFGICSLFASGLFGIGVEFQRIGTILTAYTFFSAAVSFLIPVDVTQMSASFLYIISEELSIGFFQIIIEILCLVNFIIAAFTKGNKSYLILAGAVLLCLVGIELSFYLVFPFFIYGFGAIAVGTILYCRQIYKMYLWI